MTGLRKKSISFFCRVSASLLTSFPTFNRDWLGSLSPNLTFWKDDLISSTSLTSHQQQGQPQSRASQHRVAILSGEDEMCGGNCLKVLADQDKASAWMLKYQNSVYKPAMIHQNYTILRLTWWTQGTAGAGDSNEASGREAYTLSWKSPVLFPCGSWCRLQSMRGLLCAHKLTWAAASLWILRYILIKN